MKALLIKDELVWGRRSTDLGANFTFNDSSNNMLIFAKNTPEKDIRKIIGKAPHSAYQLLDLEEVSEAECEFMADSDTCYRQIH